MVHSNRLWALPLGVVFCLATAFGQGGEPDVLRDPEQVSPLGQGESTGFGHALTWAGTRMVIGAPRSFGAGDRSGALWAWNPDKKELTPIAVPGYRDWSSLGWSLKTDPSGILVAAGAPGETVAGVAAGAVHLVRSGPTGLRWQERLEPDAPESNGGFGHALAWGQDALWIAAPFASGGLGHQEGYVARYAPSGTGLELAERWNSPIPQVGARFGEALVVTGSEIVVGAPGQSGGGAVFVMSVAGSGAPRVQGISSSVPLPAHGGFGASVAVASDRSAMGIPWFGSGAVQLYVRQGSGSWTPHGLVVAPEGSGASAFGGQIAFEGNQLWISAPGGSGQLFCMANWRSGLEPLLFASGTGDVALGRAFLMGGSLMCLGAPGHGQATFEPAVKASVRMECGPRLQHHELGAGVSVQTVVHGAPWTGVLALGAGGLPPHKRVELRIWDPAVAGGWAPLGAGSADDSGAWKWSGTLPGSASGYWRLALQPCNGPLRSLRVPIPACD
ncbi:MAG: hypothetical protein P1V35_03370 [Planctomycetota bacterium]|nr:hypothetical protein [Planctomycetota bacterium]